MVPVPRDLASGWDDLRLPRQCEESKNGKKTFFFCLFLMLMPLLFRRVRVERDLYGLGPGDWRGRRDMVGGW